MILRVIFVVLVLLDDLDADQVVLHELVQVIAPLEAKYARNLKESFFILINIATDSVTVFNISILLTCKVCRV